MYEVLEMGQSIIFCRKKSESNEINHILQVNVDLLWNKNHAKGNLYFEASKVLVYCSKYSRAPGELRRQVSIRVLE